MTLRAIGPDHGAESDDVSLLPLRRAESPVRRYRDRHREMRRAPGDGARVLDAILGGRLPAKPGRRASSAAKEAGAMIGPISTTAMRRIASRPARARSRLRQVLSIRMSPRTQDENLHAMRPQMVAPTPRRGRTQSGFERLSRGCPVRVVTAAIRPQGRCGNRRSCRGSRCRRSFIGLGRRAPAVVFRK